MQAKDIPELPVLRFIAKVNRVEPAIMFAGYERSVLNAMPPGTPEKVGVAKMASLIKRGLVDGHTGVGFRGDFELTRAGQDYLREAAR